jgi:hypothetical protein
MALTQGSITKLATLSWNSLYSMFAGTVSLARTVSHFLVVLTLAGLDVTAVAAGAEVAAIGVEGLLVAGMPTLMTFLVGTGADTVMTFLVEGEVETGADTGMTLGVGGLPTHTCGGTFPA